MIEHMSRGLALSLVLLTLGCTPYDYCSEAKRALTDEELIAKAIRKELSAGTMKIDDPKKSIEGFLASYPNCCRVHRKPNVEGIEVEMYYEVNNRNVQNGLPSAPMFYEQHFVMDACGKILRPYGMQVKDSDRPCWAREERVSKLSDLELIKVALTRASKEMRLDASALERFVSEHPSCCRVSRNVQDKSYPSLLNAAQVDIYFTGTVERSSEPSDLSHILVALNACADFAHMYGPQRVVGKGAPK
jgi:hypothetical protein